jgi:hypothetical protein
MAWISGPHQQCSDVLVSRTIKDLVAGTGITFAERGSHALNGPQDEWPLFAVTGFVRHHARGSGRGTPS